MGTRRWAAVISGGVMFMAGVLGVLAAMTVVFVFCAAVRGDDGGRVIMFMLPAFVIVLVAAYS